MKIVAFDPGITTGYAVGLLNVDHGLLQIKFGQKHFSLLEFYNELKDSKPNIIVYEQFEYRNRARPGLELASKEFIGIIKMYAEERSVNLCEQMPSLVGAGGKTGPFKDKKLQEVGLYRPSTPHGHDALRHLLYWWEFGPGYRWNKQGFTTL